MATLKDINMCLSSNPKKIVSRQVPVATNSRIKVDIDLLNSRDIVEQVKHVKPEGLTPSFKHKARQVTQKGKKEKLKKWSHQPPTLSSPKNSIIRRSKNGSIDLDEQQPKKIKTQIRVNQQQLGKQSTQLDRLIEFEEQNKARIDQQYAQHFQILESSASSVQETKFFNEQPKVTERQLEALDDPEENTEFLKQDFQDSVKREKQRDNRHQSKGPINLKTEKQKYAYCTEQSFPKEASEQALFTNTNMQGYNDEKHDDIEDHIKQSDTVKTEYLFHNASTQRGLQQHTNFSQKQEERKIQFHSQLTQKQKVRIDAFATNEVSPQEFHTREFELEFKQQTQQRESEEKLSKSNRLPTRAQKLSQEYFEGQNILVPHNQAAIKIITNNQPGSIVYNGFQNQSINSIRNQSQSPINKDLPNSNQQSQIVQIVNQSNFFRGQSNSGGMAEAKSTGIDFSNIDFGDLQKIDREIRRAKQRSDHIEKYQLLEKALQWQKQENLLMDKNYFLDQGHKFPTYEELRLQSELGFMIEQKNKQLKKEKQKQEKQQESIQVANNSLDCKVSTLQKSFDNRLSITQGVKEAQLNERIKRGNSKLSPISIDKIQIQNQSKTDMNSGTSVTQENKQSTRNGYRQSNVSFNNQVLDQNIKDKSPFTIISPGPQQNCLLTQLDKSSTFQSQINNTQPAQETTDSKQARCFSNIEQNQNQIQYKEIQAKQFNLELQPNSSSGYQLTNRSSIKRQDQSNSSRQNKQTVVVLPTVNSQVNSPRQRAKSSSRSNVLCKSIQMNRDGQELENINENTEGGSKPSKTAQNSPRFQDNNSNEKSNVKSASSSAIYDRNESVTVDSKNTRLQQVVSAGTLSAGTNRRLSQSTRKIQAILRETYLNPNSAQCIRKERMTLNQKIHLMRKIEESIQRSQGVLQERLQKDRQVMLNRDMIFDQHLAENTKVNEKRKRLAHPNSLERLASLHQPNLEDEIIKFINFDDKQRSMIIKDLRDMHLCTLKPTQTQRLFTHRSYERNILQPVKLDSFKFGKSPKNRKARSQQRGKKEAKSQKQLWVYSGNGEADKLPVKTLIIEDSDSAPNLDIEEQVLNRSRDTSKNNVLLNLVSPKYTHPLSISTPQFLVNSNPYSFEKNYSLIHSYNLQENAQDQSTVQSQNSAVVIQNNNISSVTSNNGHSGQEMNFNSSNHFNRGTLLASSYEMSPLRKATVRAEIPQAKQNFDLSMDNSPFSTQLAYQENQVQGPRTNARNTQLKNVLVDNLEIGSKSAVGLQTQVVQAEQMMRKKKKKRSKMKGQLRHSRKILQNMEPEMVNHDNMIKIVDINELGADFQQIIDLNDFAVLDRRNPFPYLTHQDSKIGTSEEQYEDDSHQYLNQVGKNLMTERNIDLVEVETPGEIRPKKEGLFSGDFHKNIEKRLKHMKLDFNTFGTKNPFQLDLRDKQFQKQLNSENMHLRPGYSLEPKFEQQKKKAKEVIPKRNINFKSQKRVTPLRVDSPKYRPAPTRSLLSAKQRLTGKSAANLDQQIEFVVKNQIGSTMKTNPDEARHKKQEQAIEKERVKKEFRKQKEAQEVRELLVEDIKQEIEQDMAKGNLLNKSNDLFASMSLPNSTMHMSNAASSSMFNPRSTPSGIWTTNVGRNTMIKGIESCEGEIQQVPSSQGNMRATVQSWKKPEMQSDIPNLDLANLGFAQPIQCSSVRQRSQRDFQIQSKNSTYIQRKKDQEMLLSQQEYELFGKFIDTPVGTMSQIQQKKRVAQPQPLQLKIRSSKIELRELKREDNNRGFAGYKMSLNQTRQVQRMKGYEKKAKDITSPFGQTNLTSQSYQSQNPNMIIIPNLDLQNRDIDKHDQGGTLPRGTFDSALVHDSGRKNQNDSIIKSTIEPKNMILTYDDQSSLLNQKSPKMSEPHESEKRGSYEGEILLESVVRMKGETSYVDSRSSNVRIQEQ